MPFPEGLSPGKFVELLWERHYRTLYLYVRGFCRGNQLRLLSIEDVLHEFFLSVMEKHEQFIPGYRDAGLPYLLTALKYQLINWGRKKRDHNLPENDQSHEKFEGLVDKSSPTFLLDLECFYKLLDQYLKKDSQVIKLWIEDFSYNEIAQKLDMKIGTVGTKINRSKLIVKKLWNISFSQHPERDQKEYQ